MRSKPLYAAIEGGGTKFVCAVGPSADETLESIVIATTDPHATLDGCVQFFERAERTHGKLDAFGFGCFGPIDLRADAPTYGHMLATPKAGWSRADLLAPFRQKFTAPILIETDVAGAALAEWRLGAGRGLGSVVYVTVGTGIGGAVAPGDASIRRLMHAEMGHIPMRRDPRDRHPGVCPFHGDCLEGLASGPAINARWGQRLDQMSDDHEAWSIIGGYLGQLAASISLMLSVERIVFGGGVMLNHALLPHIREATRVLLNGYLEPLGDARALDAYISSPQLGDRAGISGAFLLAEQASQR